MYVCTCPAASESESKSDIEDIEQPEKWTTEYEETVENKHVSTHS